MEASSTEARRSLIAALAPSTAAISSATCARVEKPSTPAVAELIRARRDRRWCSRPPDDRRVEGPEPPARQRLVVFLDPVPFVARGLVVEIVVFLVCHFRASLWPVLDPGDMGLSSWRNGMFAASSYASRDPGRKAQTTMQAKKSDHAPAGPSCRRVGAGRNRFPSRASSAACVGREGREVDQRAQHLQVGDQRVLLGQPGWPSKLRTLTFSP